MYLLNYSLSKNLHKLLFKFSINSFKFSGLFKSIFVKELLLMTFFSLILILDKIFNLLSSLKNRAIIELSKNIFL